MIYATIFCDIKDNVALVALNRTEVMNILNTQMRAEITLVVRESGRIARMIVLTGAGRAFLLGSRFWYS